jgi:DNA-directed RNA polymerase II subunit RPB9
MGFEVADTSNNMLYPKEDRINQRLLYSCRNCDYTEIAENNCIYRNELMSALAETAGVTQDISSDPTLPRSDKECPQCHERECVFFQSQQRTADTSLVMFYVCVHCGHIFRSDESTPE